MVSNSQPWFFPHTLMSLWGDYLADEFKKKTVRRGRKQVERNRGHFKKWESRFEESQNYEVAESMEYKKNAVRDYLGVGTGMWTGMGAASSAGRGGRRSASTVFLKRAFYRWALIFFIGFLCAVFGVGIHMLTIFLVTFKNDLVTGYMYSVSVRSG